MHIEVEDRLGLLPFIGVLLPDANHLAHDLGVEAVALGFGENVADIVRDALLFLLQPLDPLDEGSELARRYAARLGHSELPKECPSGLPRRACEVNSPARSILSFPRRQRSLSAAFG